LLFFKSVVQKQQELEEEERGKEGKGN